LESRALKIAVGLALESAILSRAETGTLVSLYSDPNPQGVWELHDRLMESGDHRERETAIWLETGLEADPMKSDPAGLVVELREMEYVLFAFISRAGGAQREVNDWMNYIANAAQFIVDGFLLDAKIMLSRALQASRAPAVEELKSEPGLSYEVGVFQEATASYFNEVKWYPVALRIPEERLDTILTLQRSMLEIMRSRMRLEAPEEPELIRGIIQRLSSSLRHLMEENAEEARRELGTVTRQIGDWLDLTEDAEKRGLVEGHGRSIREALDSL
jgi:signal transduction histidine kinase